MTKQFLLASAFVAGAVSFANTSQMFAQTGAAATTPASCTKAANDWRIAQSAPALSAYRNATDANRADLQKKLLDANNAAANGAAKMAGDCAAKFSVETIPAAQLMDLVTLSTLAKDTAKARLATDRLLSEKSLPQRTKAQGMMLEVNRAIAANPNLFGIIDDAEKVMKQIDALPDSLNDIKIQAHATMLGRYEYLDVASGLESHALAIIALSKNAPTSNAMASAYHSLARSFADRLQPDSALKILDAGEKIVGVTAASRSFEDFRNRYELIGKPAAKIDAEWWINTDAKSVVTPVPGQVTLIEFTAHWCGPCKNSYPGLRSLTERLKGKAFGGVMVTQLYGYLGTRQNLTPEQELAADREYFGKEHAVPFPVAINPPVKQVGASFMQPKPDMEYRVGGIPQIMIVDKKGIIRQIVTGWDQGNTERFSKYIDLLLAEKP